ncbi:MAG TPA: hypothetical protein VGG40_13470 [Solirubrobacterales bacterium]|jgi:hypothetical protein
MKLLSKRHSVSLVVGALAVSAAIAAGSAIASGEPTACETVSLAFLQTTVGLKHSTLLRDANDLEGTGGEEPSELPQAFHSECGIGLWSGKAPKGQAATFEKARAGKAAQVGVDVWAPNDDSPNVGEWESKGFEELTAGFLKGRFQAVLKLPGIVKPLNPEGDGYSGAGITVKATGPAHGLEAAAGCWWDVSTHRAICLLTEEAEGKPVVNHLNTLAKKLVPSFLGAPWMLAGAERPLGK